MLVLRRVVGGGRRQRGVRERINTPCACGCVHCEMRDMVCVRMVEIEQSAIHLSYAHASLSLQLAVQSSFRSWIIYCNRSMHNALSAPWSTTPNYTRERLTMCELSLALSIVPSILLSLYQSLNHCSYILARRFCCIPSNKHTLYTSNVPTPPLHYKGNRAYDAKECLRTLRLCYNS